MLNAQIVGNIGNEPEMKYSADGKPILRLSVASNYRERDAQGEWQDKVEWVRVTILGPRAETLNQYLKKGLKIFAHGSLKARPWKGEHNDRLNAGLELLANDIEFVSPREDGDERPSGQPARGKPAAESELPF